MRAPGRGRRSDGPFAVTCLRLDHPPFAGRTGAGVRVAIIDSGVQAAHPHLGGAAGGAVGAGGVASGGVAAGGVASGGVAGGAVAGRAVVGGATIVVDSERGTVRVEEGAFADRIGHGTAVAAAIHEKAPGAALWAVKVFDRRLATSAPVLAAAIDHAAERGARLINLSLGTENAEHVALLEAAVRRAAARGAVVVGALESGGAPCYPGALAGAVAVLPDDALARDELRVVAEGGRVTLRASPYPRPIPGVPPERNLSGVSFAVANATAFLARLLEEPGAVTPEGVLAGRWAAEG